MWASVKGEGNPENRRCYLGWRPACGLSLLWEWQEGVMVFTIEVNCRITEIKKREWRKGMFVQEWWVCEGDTRGRSAQW